MTLILELGLGILFFFPKGTNPYAKDMLNRPPARPAEMCIVDPNLKRLLMAPKIKNANLNTSVFKTTSATKLSGTAFVNVDYFMRKALLDAYYTDELLNNAIEFVPLLRTKLLKDNPDLDQSSLDLMYILVSMISLSNQRTYHGLTAAI